MKYILLALLSLNAFADTSRDVFIRGKIGNEFDEKKVKVIDSEGQSYYLARKLFPKNMVIKQGQSFAIEVREKELNKIKILKK
jgi:hypothetical protein